MASSLCSSSTKRLCDDTKDRFSELPRNVIDCILERMLIRDATRTSILSRKWRYIWASIPQLVFDKHFFNEINRKHEKFIHYEFPKAINKVFFVHDGHILKFLLHIPITSNDLSLEIDNWMLSLSRKGIKELQLENSNLTPYNLPSCIFLCDTLIDLNLKNCTLKPPNAWEGFRYLVKLRLVNVSFPTNMSTKILHNAPMLRELILFYCTGIELQNINAPNLTMLDMVMSGKVDWQWFERSRQLGTVRVHLCNRVKNVERTVNLTILFKYIPTVRTLSLDGFSLKFLAPGDPAQSLPTSRHLVPALFLTYIRLSEFRVNDVYQISSVICLLRICPNLMFLDIDFNALGENVGELFLSYLSSNHKDMKLERLKAVRIRFLKGLKAELLFIKLLLACSTGLQRMTIDSCDSIGLGDMFKISRELLRYFRASSRAEIIYMEGSTHK